MSFTPIETQEDFDKAIQKRLDQQERQMQEKYRDYLSPEKVEALRREYDKKLSDKDGEMQTALSKYDGYDQKLLDMTKRAEDAEKANLRAKVANDSKLPFELSSRILGNTEEEMKKDAEALAQFVRPQAPAPLYNPVPSSDSSGHGATDAALNSLLSNLIQK